MQKLAVITTHPIQYYAPVFKLLHQRGKVQLKVFYTAGKNDGSVYDPGFNRDIQWDIPLLEGYNYEWVVNTAKEPGSHHFNGIINPDVIEQINSWQPDAVLVIGWAYSSHLRVMRYYKRKIPVYFRGDSTLLDERSGIRQLRRLLMLRWVYSHIDTAFYVGTNNRAYFRKYGLRDVQLTFAPHAIDNERFGIDRVDEVKQLRSGLGIDDNAILILFAGKFDEKKSPELLLDAFITIDRPDIHLLFAGNGNLEDKLKEKAAGYENIHFLPFQNQLYMPVVYQSCNLFCLPSKGPAETWGLAVNEAMACGKGVLVSDKVGCAVDLVSESNGAIFKSEDKNALILSLKGLVESKEKLAKLGLTSKNNIQSWNFEHIATAIEHKLISDTDQRRTISEK